MRNPSFSQGFIRVSAYWSGFDGIGQVDILNIGVASGIGRVKMLENPGHSSRLLFLKGPLVGSSGDATTHFAPARDWRRATLRNRSFLTGFKGFLCISMVSMVLVRSALWGGMRQKTRKI